MPLKAHDRDAKQAVGSPSIINNVTMLHKLQIMLHQSNVGN